MVSVYVSVYFTLYIGRQIYYITFDRLMLTASALAEIFVSSERDHPL